MFHACGSYFVCCVTVTHIRDHFSVRVQNAMAKVQSEKFAIPMTDAIKKAKHLVRCKFLLGSFRFSGIGVDIERYMNNIENLPEHCHSKHAHWTPEAVAMNHLSAVLLVVDTELQTRWYLHSPLVLEQNTF